MQHVTRFSPPAATCVGVLARSGEGSQGKEDEGKRDAHLEIVLSSQRCPKHKYVDVC